MARRHYSDEAKAAALGVLDANGGNVNRASKETGVPGSTLIRWRNEPDKAAPPELREQKRVELVDVYNNIAAKGAGLLDGAMDLLTPEDVAGDTKLMAVVSTVAGTATDKGQLLSGKATSRVETRDADMTPDEALAIVRRERELRVVEGGKGKRSA